MYDFFLGTPDEIFADEETYLLSVKRLLPRWLNSIPDSEYIAIHRLLRQHLRHTPLTLVETGIGASTLVLLYHAVKSGGVLFSWDLASPKGSEIRAVATETHGALFGRSLWNHWIFVAANSLSPYLGLAILKERNAAVDFCFLDSDHCWDTLRQELELVSDVTQNSAVISIDDANYRFRHVNIAYVNMFRQKLALPPTSGPMDNICEPFGEEAERLLRTRFPSVERLRSSYPDECRSDIFLTYYANDRVQMDRKGMEILSRLEERFQAWKVARE